MTDDFLLEAGRRLARPCLHLAERGDGDGPVAVWGGPGLVPPPPGSFRHWLTIAAACLPDVGLDARPGCLSVYSDEEDCRTGVVAHDGSMSLTEVSTGLPLHGRKRMSLPPLDAVFLLGPPAVREWLEANGWTPEEPYNDNFPDRGPAEAYNRAWMGQNPLYGEGVYAQVGGWHMPWPDGDWYGLLERKLVAWTLEDSEPWVEAWLDADGDFEVIQRMT
jgi:hypothetical protein